VISAEDALEDNPFSLETKNIANRGRFWGPFPPVPAEGELALKVSSKKTRRHYETLRNPGSSRGVDA
jgi:hypothetical protein